MKILTLSELNQQRHGVLAHGAFDLLHLGHIRHLLWARSLMPSGPLIVTITADQHIKKGPGRPVFTASERAECVAALECVDWVAIVDAPTALPAIEAAHPAIYVKGGEYWNAAGVMDDERRAVEGLGGRVEFMPARDHGYSSTYILSGELFKERSK